MIDPLDRCRFAQQNDWAITSVSTFKKVRTCPGQVLVCLAAVLVFVLGSVAVLVAGILVAVVLIAGLVAVLVLVLVLVIHLFFLRKFVLTAWPLS